MNPANRLALNYSEASQSFRRFNKPIIDIHSHIHGKYATSIYLRAAADFGVGVTFSMTLLEYLPEVSSIMGDRVRFIAVPDFVNRDRIRAHGKDYITRLKQYRAHGSRIAKFWTAPRLYEGSSEPFSKNPLRLTGALRQETMKVAIDLGMIFMVHIGDPDTWFQTKYRDSTKYGTKRQQYEDLEEALRMFQVPWIAAHMGGYPEDLEFLSELLTRHSNLYLDCSATKWIVRELSKHSPEKLRDFFTRWSGRILFGSDIVTTDAHISPDTESLHIGGAHSANAEEAYDLYASRYWALRTLLETDYVGESPIADPDLNLVDPDRYTLNDAPQLRGASLPLEVLEVLYYRAAFELLGDSLST